MAKRKQETKALANYLKADGSGWLIVLTLALLPPLGIYWVYRYSRQYMVAIDARLYGSWVDPYTGQTLTGNPYQGDGAGNDLDIARLYHISLTQAGYNVVSGVLIECGIN